MVAARSRPVKIRGNVDAVRKMLRIGVRTGLLLAILFAVLKLVQSRREAVDDGWAPAEPDNWPPVQDAVEVEPPAPITTREAAPPAAPVKKAPPVKKAAAKKAPAKKAPGTKKAPAGKKAAPTTVTAPQVGGRIVWVEPTGRICPPSHPIKAKLSSRIFHLPGMAAYNRTAPDRCYVDEPSAVADGFTRAQR